MMNRKTDRRAALKILTAAPLGLAASAAIVRDTLAETMAAEPRFQAVTRPIEPRAGTWTTWVLSSGSELRLPPPPSEGTTQAELAELQALTAQRDAVALDRISYWDAGAPSYRWTDRAVKYT
jgi:hypothetical protein